MISILTGIKFWCPWVGSLILLLMLIIHTHAFTYIRVSTLVLCTSEEVTVILYYHADLYLQGNLLQSQCGDVMPLLHIRLCLLLKVILNGLVGRRYKCEKKSERTSSTQCQGSCGGVSECGQILDYQSTSKTKNVRCGTKAGSHEAPSVGTGCRWVGPA